MLRDMSETGRGRSGNPAAANSTASTRLHILCGHGTYDRVVFAIPEPAPGEPVTVSGTTYLTLMQCADHAMARLEGMYPAETKQSFRGVLAHRVFARHLEQGAIADDDIAQVCKEEIGSALNPKLSALKIRPSELRRVIDEVGDLYTRFKRIPVDGFESAEVFIETEPHPGMTLKGSVDAVFSDADGVRLVDWKTGSLGEAAVQLDFYTLLWVLDRGRLPDKTEAVSVLTGEHHETVPTLGEAQATAARVAEFVTRVREAFVAGERLDRRGGPWCRYCPLLGDCDEGAAAAKVV